MNGGVPRQQKNWDWRAAGNFVCGGTGAGLLLFAALSASGVAYLASALAALALIATGLTLVWLEIGRTWRFLNVFINPRTSWMSRESIAALAVFGLGFGAAWLRLPAMALAAAAAGLVFLYCQARILTAAKGIPAWREKRVEPLILATGLTEGAGLLLLAAPVLGASPAWLPPALVALVILRQIAVVVYLRRLRRNGAPTAALAALGRAATQLLALGTAVPIVLVAAAWPLLSPFAGPILAAAGLAAAAGGWLFKYALVVRAAQTQGFAIPRTPVRGRGQGGPGDRPGWSRSVPEASTGRLAK